MVSPEQHRPHICVIPGKLVQTELNQKPYDEWHSCMISKAWRIGTRSDML